MGFKLILRCTASFNLSVETQSNGLQEKTRLCLVIKEIQRQTSYVDERDESHIFFLW